MEAFFWIMAGIIWLIYHLIKVYGLTPKNTWWAIKQPESGCLFWILFPGVPFVCSAIVEYSENHTVQKVFFFLEAIWIVGWLVLIGYFCYEDWANKKNREEEQFMKQEREEEEDED